MSDNNEHIAGDWFGAIIYILILGSSLLGGLFIIGMQIFFYLKEGAWNSVSIIDGLVELNLKWAINPQDWLGLWNILDFLPLSVSLLVLGFIILVNE